MSHRKVLSQGNVPFSWEDKPGVSKFTHQDYPTDMRLGTLVFSAPPPPSTSPCDSGKKIPPPPPCPFQPPRRSFSAKGLWQEGDPFLAAFKECTKSNGGEISKNSFGSKAWISKYLIFSCKQACDVRDDHLVRPSNLPPLPRGRFRGLIKMRD